MCVCTVSDPDVIAEPEAVEIMDDNVDDEVDADEVEENVSDKFRKRSFSNFSHDSLTLVYVYKKNTIYYIM